MDGLYWKTLLKWMIWGYPYFRKHPNPWDLKIHKMMQQPGTWITWIAPFICKVSHQQKMSEKNMWWYESLDIQTKWTGFLGSNLYIYYTTPVFIGLSSLPTFQPVPVPSNRAVKLFQSQLHLLSLQAFWSDFFGGFIKPYCWWFRNPAWKPVEVGSWNPTTYKVWDTSQLVVWMLFGNSEPSTVGINRHILSWWARGVQSPKRNAVRI